MTGKGSAPRPFSVSNEEYAKRWDAIFGKDLEKPEVTPEEEEAWKDLEKKIEKRLTQSEKDVIIDICADK
jgi:hypothetical protein